MASRAQLYVATSGNDSWSGTRPEPNAAGTDGPFATLTRARDAARELRTGDVDILIREGLHLLTETFVIGLRDSAGTSRTITYAACPGEKPILSAGVPVTSWRRPSEFPPELPEATRPHVWVADVADHPAMKPMPDERTPRFLTLFRGARELPRARGPGFSPANDEPKGSKNYNDVEFPPGAVQRYANLADAELRIVPSQFWVMNLLPLAAVDEAGSTLTTAQPGTYTLGKNRMTDRDNAWIENALELLDQPDEWVLDAKRGLLWYWPSDGEPGPDIVAPALTELVRVEGEVDYDGPTDQPVEGIVFRDLTFTHGDRRPWHGRTGWGLQHDWELFDKPTALLRFRGAQRCAVENCEFVNSGHAGLRLDLHCREIRVVGNHLHHLGGAGILLAGYGPGTKDVNKRNEICNNAVHNIGSHYWGSSAIFLWQSGENRVAHNLIHHTPYAGILVTGRITGREPGPAECSRTVRHDDIGGRYTGRPWHEREPYLHGRKNTVAHNDIHHVMERLGDGNAIYVSGTGGGNVVCHNYCHHCDGPYMNAVIRCDDDQHETRMTHNVCFRTSGHAEGFISKGRNDIINNVVADLRPDQAHRGYIVFPYTSVAGSVIERNILLSCQKGQILYHENRPSQFEGAPPTLRETKADFNLYYCTADPDWATAHLEEQRSHGIETHSRAGDPLFVDMANGDFGFTPGSPALELGIEPIDVRQAGLEQPYRERLSACRTASSPAGPV